LTSISGRAYEIKYLVGNLVLSVEKYLILLVNPVEGQISYTNALPHVAHLAAGAVNNVCHLVGNDEF